MPVFPEYFDVPDFKLNVENAFIMKRPYINFGKTINFKWQEYNSNIKLQCVMWQSILFSCINIYGYFDFMKNIRCFVT
jgi:hypothetical protein